MQQSAFIDSICGKKHRTCQFDTPVQAAIWKKNQFKRLVTWLDIDVSSYSATKKILIGW